MTRRKRTPSSSPSPSPSPSASSKRVAFDFEIPASLRQFSSISRSLATHTTIPSAPATASPQTQTEPQHRPVSQSSSQSSPRFTIPRPTSQVPVNAQSQRSSASVHNSQPWATPLPKGVQATSAAKSSSPAFPKPTPTQPPNGAPAHSHSRTTSNPNSKARPQPEPILRPGETPVLKTHPNLIASLIAKKRAANEAAGHRARWQRQQAEYQAGKSPGSQLMTELKAEASRASPVQSQSISVSNPLPARPVSLPATNSKTGPPRVETAGRTTDTVSTPNTEQSTHETETSKGVQQDRRDSVYASPFSSPIADFLEQATDEVELQKNITDTTQQPAHSSEPFKDQTPSSTAHGQDSVVWPLQNGNMVSSTQVGIPPLFSELPQLHQQKQSPLLRTPFPQNHPRSSRSSQQQASPYQSPHFSTGQLQSGNVMSNSAALAQQQYQYMNSQFPDGQQNFYKMNYPQQYPTTNSPEETNMTVPITMRQQSFAQQSLSNAPSFNPLLTYPTQPISGLGNMNMPLVYPPSAPMPTFGTSAPKSRTELNPGLMTAADMVAGTNTMFTVATQTDFSVPKRY
ncbi:uncharacterized protein A1O9_00107 [Exophiala aquamarina CBS 119918]|uniref:Uncharacterized protein n=1 Tax=Exophiala aquamarina CBS 119918 TaxID=1182545 RepID=A0A072Q2K3_9EURO|nr:uncharacterized protein A1O9_00107 [Exophiala aquamarina CBS 119918]KEF62135.1 hypothetical protein A1O9_00107 [Exophiala aquamarina CBS 119918]